MKCSWWHNDCLGNWLIAWLSKAANTSSIPWSSPHDWCTQILQLSHIIHVSYFLTSLGSPYLTWRTLLKKILIQMHLNNKLEQNDNLKICICGCWKNYAKILGASIVSSQLMIYTACDNKQDTKLYSDKISLLVTKRYQFSPFSQ